MRDDTIRVLKEFQVKTFGNKKRIENAEQMIHADEEILFLAPTNCTIISTNTQKKEALPGIAILTNFRFLFVYKAVNYHSTEVISVSEIRAVNCSGDGISGGHIEIHTLTKTYDILVSYKKNIQQKIQATFEKASAEANTTTDISSSVSYADEIRKFKKLLDEGIITQEEFEDKKKCLLQM